MKRKEFREFLLNLQKPFIIKIETETKLKLNKTHRETKQPNPYFDDVIKRCTRVGKIGVNYENIVTNQRGREAEVGETIEQFNAESLWKGKGEHVSGALVRHKDSGKEYLAILPNSSNENEVIVKDKLLLHGNELISDDILLPYLPPKRNDDNSNQGTEKRIFWQTIELANIKSVIYKGETISIEE